MLFAAQRSSCRTTAEASPPTANLIWSSRPWPSLLRLTRTLHDLADTEALWRPYARRRSVGR
jgi:hypothetical protein